MPDSKNLMPPIVAPELVSELEKNPSIAISPISQRAIELAALSVELVLSLIPFTRYKF